jgi:hypothetical protein
MGPIDLAFIRPTQSPPLIFLRRRPTYKITRTPTQDRGAAGGCGTYQEPLLDQKSTITATLAFLHPGAAVLELCIIGPKAPKSSLWEGYAAGKNRLWPVGTGTAARRWRLSPRGSPALLQPATPDFDNQVTQERRQGSGGPAFLHQNVIQQKPRRRGRG